ncbi:MAG: glycoside hydrolase family 20 zincin-like fold domain-containing protein [Planctomycetota bacterium]
MNRIRFIFALLFVWVPFAPISAEPPPPDRSVWEQVDIIPMPKRIRLTGQRLPLANAVIVVGENPSEQDQIGAQWINEHIVAKGGKALTVTTEAKAEGNAPLRIVIGTRDTCKAVGEAAKAGVFKLGPDVPGKQGYVIHPRKRDGGADLLLGGADPVGALYACVTFAGLLDKEGNNVVVREAEVVDWPDYRICTEGWNLYNVEVQDAADRARWSRSNISEESKQAYLRAMRAHIDRLLEWKISCFKADDLRYWNKLSPEFLAVYKEITSYAKARGIHSLYYALPPAVGFREDLPDAPVRCLTGVGRDRYTDLVRCWSMDEERRPYARRIGEFAKAAGLTDIGFHDWDTGAYLSPAQWEERCDVCRKRWGDDFAAATINKHRILYEEIKKVYPDVWIHFTLYPYGISILTQQAAEAYHINRYGPGPSVPETARRLRERYTEFWKQVTKGLPPDVTFCIRENIPENVRIFHELTKPHGTFIWYLAGSKYWRPFFDVSPCWAPTFYSGRDDVMFTVSMETFVPLKGLAVREYTWNTKAPGATGWSTLPDEEWWQNGEPKGEIYSVILPHIVRNLFGRAAAPELTEALSLNMATNHIFDFEFTGKTLPLVLTTYEKWKWQADLAEKGCALVDQVFKRFAESKDRLGMSDYAARRFIYIREVFHSSKWMAQAKMHNIHARELAKAGKLDDAREAIRLGKQAVAEGRGDMERLLAQRPDDPVYNAKPKDPKRPPYWKMFTPGNRVDFDVPAKMLAQTEKELTSLAAAGDLPERALQMLEKRSMVHLAPASQPPTIDGRLDEPVWRNAVPAEAFFVDPAGQGIARAHTRARFFRDEKTLYFGATCWMPGNSPIQSKAREHDGPVMDDEQVELFLMPPQMKGGYVQFQINADGSIADKRVMVEKNDAGVNVKKRDPAWNAEGVAVKTTRGEGIWELEMAIPLATIGAKDWKGGWHVNVCRDFKGPTRELSSIMRPTGKDFHDTAAFLELKFDPTPAPPPEVEIAVAGVKEQTRTLDDRIATVLDFGLDIRSTRVLRNVRITAEAYDATGRLHGRSVLKELPHLAFYWNPTDTFTIGFEQEVKIGGMRILLESSEVKAERWVHLGGWTGAPEHGLIFDPASTGLTELCNLPSEILPPAAQEPMRLLDRRKGTVEIWLKPEWPALHPVETALPWSPRHVVYHCGIMRREHPLNFNCSSVILYHDAAGKSLVFAIANHSYTGWNVQTHVPDTDLWKQPNWRHIACVWDHDAKPGDWLRLYLDGKRVPVETRISKPERLPADKGVELDKTAYAFQVGGLNTGRNPACAVIDDLRISRMARYDADFTPDRKPFEIDKDTSAVFHFNGTLKGEGMTEEGKRYAVDGVAGALEWH